MWILHPKIGQNNRKKRNFLEENMETEHVYEAGHSTHNAFYSPTTKIPPKCPPYLREWENWDKGNRLDLMHSFVFPILLILTCVTIWSTIHKELIGVGWWMPFEKLALL